MAEQPEKIVVEIDADTEKLTDKLKKLINDVEALKSKMSSLSEVNINLNININWGFDVNKVISIITDEMLNKLKE